MGIQGEAPQNPGEWVGHKPIDFIASQALGAVAPLCMGVGSKDSVPAGFPKKDSGLAPEGLSIRTGIGGRSPAIVVSHNGPKNQNTWGRSRRAPPGASFPPFFV